MKRLVREYWRGKKTLIRTFVNFLLLPSLFALLLRQSLLNHPPEPEPGKLIYAAFLLLLVYCLAAVITLVGINRKARILEGGYGSNTNVTLCNALSLVLIAYTCINLIDLFTVNASATNNEQHTIVYSPIFLADDKEGDTLLVHGDIGIAATKRLAALLEENTETKKLILESDGGSIFEARGIAKLIAKKGLHTHVEGKCLSACTLIYVSGDVRSASPTAQFGFHAYQLQTNYGGVGYGGVRIDIDEQQDIDADVFASAGVDADFIDQIYGAQYGEMWFPERKLLVEAGFINQIGSD